MFWLQTFVVRSFAKPLLHGKLIKFTTRFPNKLPSNVFSIGIDIHQYYDKSTWNCIEPKIFRHEQEKHVANVSRKQREHNACFSPLVFSAMVACGLLLLLFFGSWLKGRM